MTTNNFDPDLLAREQEELQQQSAAPGFWDNPEQALGATRRMSRIQDTLELCREIRQGLQTSGNWGSSQWRNMTNSSPAPSQSGRGERALGDGSSHRRQQTDGTRDIVDTRSEPARPGVKRHAAVQVHREYPQEPNHRGGQG